MQRHVPSLLLGIAVSLLLSACVNRYPDDFYRRSGSSGAASVGMTTPARTLEQYKAQIAQQITLANTRFTYADNPQSMLRAVIVVHYVIAADGSLQKFDIVRSNHEPELEQLALASLRSTAPFVRPPTFLQHGGCFESSETWLFNSDGRFQLRSIALPQSSE